MSRYAKGTHNAICDICAFQYKRSEMRKNWKNQLVCRADYEAKHPQLTLRPRTDRQAVKDARPEDLGELKFLSSYDFAPYATVIGYDGTEYTISNTMVAYDGTEVDVNVDALDYNGDEVPLFTYRYPDVDSQFPDKEIIPPSISVSQMV